MKLKTDDEKLKELNSEIHSLRENLSIKRIELATLETHRDLIIANGSDQDLQAVGKLKMEMLETRRAYSSLAMQFFQKVGERNQLRHARELLQHPVLQTYFNN